MRVHLAIVFSLTCSAALADGAAPPAAQAPQPVTLPVAAAAPGCREDSAKSIFGRAGSELITGLTFNIGPDGATLYPALTASSGVEALDKAALACAARWRYKPATLNGAPVSVTWSVWLH